ncbi:MAG: hypothetical protein V4713_03955 [Pseudomonadota bacterium]
MTTRTFLVSLTDRQCVEAAASTGGCYRGTQEPKALVLFCQAHMGKTIQILNEGQLEGLPHGGDELTHWTDKNAAAMYESVMGEPAPATGDE